MMKCSRTFIYLSFEPKTTNYKKSFTYCEVGGHAPIPLPSGYIDIDFITNRVKLAFHDADTDTDIFANILARVVEFQL